MTASLKKVKASMMNAIHDLPLLVAREEGFFRDQGLDVEIIRTPGSGQRDSDHQALRSNIFERTMEALYDQGACDQFRMCEWGVMKRAVESGATSGHRVAAYLRGEADAKPSTDKILERLTLPTAAVQQEPAPAQPTTETVDAAKLEALRHPTEPVAPVSLPPAALEPAKPVDLSKANEKLSSLLGKTK